MYAKRISIFIAATVISSSMLFTSCKKDSSKDSDTESAENSALAESSFNDVTTISDQASIGGAVNVRLMSDAREEGSLGSGCATVTVDTVSNPHLVTIDFGATNCVCNDGRSRRGKILVSFTGRYRDVGTIINISFNNYFVNDNQLTGTKKITNKGLNGAGHPVYQVEVNGQIIKANGAGTITWVSTRQREWTAGYDTPLNLADDAYSITGSASGTNASGKSYTLTIVKPLVRKMNCRWFESGSVDVTPEGKPTRTLDYGNSGCDADATVTILGFTFPIILK
ncbi:MAG: hypothetical protein KGO82_17570 [Bacteroidota bacterium]|nr:hypothetical protein [Bacteroidota bacterium]